MTFHRIILLLPRWRIAFLIATIVSVSATFAQSLDDRRTHKLVLDRDTVHVDSLSIAPGSFSLWKDSVLVDPSNYELDPWHAWILRGANTSHDTLIARYRVLPSLLAGPFRHKDPQHLLTVNTDHIDPFKYVPTKADRDPLGINGLNKSGSISRGILFGNNQDLSVNSALNLELSGKLTDKIGVLASVTDNNIPIQAGGNTAELQDFDKVFIKLFEDRQELIAGDFVLQRPNSHFLTYLKKSKGLSYTTLLGKDSTRQGTLGISAAISKGKFSRNVIQGIEGVQGPYRLKADDGGTFVIVLSGTERVFVDGILLTRGQENDYVIDYNTAELTFTAKRAITKDRRIVVEFQYSDKNYARTLVRLTNEWRLRRTTLRADVYTEQDSKNQPLQQSLSNVEKEVLVNAGDDPLKAVVPGADSVAYSSSEVLYAKLDTLTYTPVYRYSNDPAIAHFRVSFSVVGAGNGDYVQSQFTPSGRVFKWLGPDTLNGTIVHRGDHAPVRVLIPPRAQRVVEFGAEHRFGDRTKVWSQLAWSDDDRNTFSTIDNSDDQGFAVRAGASHALPLSARDSSLRLTIGTDNEWLSNTFRAVERFRPVEFERNWNATTVTQDGDQILASVSAGLEAGKHGTAKFTGSTFQIKQRYTGYRQALESALTLGKWDIAVSGSQLNTTAHTVVSDFFRHKARIARRMKWITVGARDEQERNRFRSDTSGSLIAGSYAFYDWEAFMQSPDTNKIHFRLGGGQRYEQALRGGSLSRSTEATSYSANFALSKDPRRKLSTTFTYRQLRILDSSLTAQKPQNTWLARIDHGMTALKGALTWDLFYEFGSGLEQRREFIYLLVPAGQGTYVWIDYNGNGIKELNEFEVASFGYEANYIRVYTQTNSYVRIFSNQLSASAELRPNVVWQDVTGIKAFLAKWSDMASFRSDRKTGTSDLGKAIDPFRVDPTDTALTAFSSSVRNTVYFDRSSRKWSVDHTWQSDRNKSLLLNGYDSRLRESNLVHIRWNTTPQWTAEVEAEAGRSVSRSDLLLGRTWAIDTRSTKPKVTWQPSTSLRVSAQFKYTDKRNHAELGGERAEIRDIGVELRYNNSGKGSLQVNGNLVAITYNGVNSSSLGNEMLTGLKPGSNITWGVTVQRRISDHLQLDLTYNGRQSEGLPTVHVGGAQVRAFF